MQDTRPDPRRTTALSRLTVKTIIFALIAVAVAVVIAISSLSTAHHDKAGKAEGERYAAVFIACTATSNGTQASCSQAAAQAGADKSGAYARSFLSSLCTRGVADGCDQLAKLP